MSGTVESDGRFILTKEMIMKECVKQGYYRTPSCNEKLYLHHKGYDGIHPNALKEYTDVKVLWLEGNCFSTLPCGRAPVAPLAVPSVDSADTVSATTVTTPDAPAGEDSAVAVSKKSAVGGADAATPMVDAVASASADDEASTVDVFASLYPTLRQLFLHGNLFNEMPNLQHFERLDTVNLSDNFINSVQSYCPFWLSGLKQLAEEEAAASNDLGAAPSPQKSAPRPAAQVDAAVAVAERVSKWFALCPHAPLDENHKCLCATLNSLNLKNNHLKSIESIAQLLCFKNLSVLDLSSNKLEDSEGVLQIVERMPNLKALYLSGNPCVRSITNYRKTLIARCKKLMHLDDRPVFDDERRLVTAWASGGLEAEKKEKQKMKQEEIERQQKRLQEFREMMASARGRDAYNTDTEEDTDSNPTPASSDDESNNAIGRGKEINAKDPRSNRALSTNQGTKRRAKPQALGHTEFHEMNYGSKSSTGRSDDEEGAAANVTQADAAGTESGLALEDACTVSKKQNGAAPHGAAAAPPAAHRDPMHMEQVAAPIAFAASVGDDDEVDVWVPPS